MVGATGLVPRPRGLRVEALAPSLLCYVGRQALEGAVVRNPEAGVGVLRVLGERLVVSEERLNDPAR